MAVTFSNHGSVIRATAQGDTIPGRYFKAIFWNLTGATESTDKLEILEKNVTGHKVYADAAPKTDGAWPIPCPDGPVDDLYISDLDNGEILAYPAER
jgi:hypothetical protein